MKNAAKLIDRKFLPDLKAGGLLAFALHSLGIFCRNFEFFRVEIKLKKSLTRLFKKDIFKYLVK